MAFTNLIRRDGRYSYRCRIPADLVPLFRRKEYKRALGTASPHEARRRAAELAAIVRDTFDEMRMSEEDTDEARRRLAELRFTIETLKHEQQMGERLEAAAKRLEAVKSGVQRLQGRHAEAREVRKDLQGTIQTLAEAMAFRASPPPPTPPSEPFSHYAKVHVAERKAGKGLEMHSESQLKTRLDLFTRILGDKPINEYKRDEIIRYVQTLEKMPASYGKSPKDAHRSISDIIARPGEKYSKTTAEKHFEAVKACFETASCHGADVRPSMFNNLVAKGAQNSKRKIWESDELKALFATPVWTGRQSKFGVFTGSWESGQHIPKDYLFWLPIIAIHSGMRLEEIAKLKAKDIRQEHGIWLIDVNVESGRNKTDGSARLVPVHQELIKIGLVAFAQAKKSDEFLFPNLTPDSAGKRGPAYSRDFGRYREHCEIYERWRDFHSFRHTFASALYDATKDILCVAAIAGHTAAEFKDLAEEKGENAATLKLQTVDYIHRNLLSMKSAIDKLDYKIDFSHLHDHNQ